MPQVRCPHNQTTRTIEKVKNWHRITCLECGHQWAELRDKDFPFEPGMRMKLKDYLKEHK